MAELASLRATVRGHVQGVFYRAFVESHALELNLAGCVRNLPENQVEVVAEGEKQKLEKLLERLKKGPPAARVDTVEVIWGEFTGDFTQFSVKY
jgi:acylphosphatase